MFIRDLNDYITKAFRERRRKRAYRLTISWLEGMGDILVYSTSVRLRSDLLKDGLSDLEKQLIELGQKQHSRQYDYSIARIIDTIFAQILRVHQAASENGRVEAGKLVGRTLVSVLEKFVTWKDNQNLVSEVLNALSQTAAIARRKGIQDHYSTFYWFSSTFKDSEVVEISDPLVDYVDTLRQSFAGSLRQMVYSNQFDLLNSALRDCLNGFWSIGAENKVWKLVHIVLERDRSVYKALDDKYSINATANQLSFSINNVATIEEWQKCLTDLDSLFHVLNSEFLPKEAEEAKSLLVDLKRDSWSSFKIHVIRDITFEVASYALFKNNPECIRLIWEAKQPHDSTTNWIEEDIFPSTINELLAYYYSLPEHAFHSHDWEERHGAEYYVKRYFLILLLRNINKEHPTAQKFGEDSFRPVFETKSARDVNRIRNDFKEFSLLSPELESSSWIAHLGLRTHSAESQTSLLRMFLDAGMTAAKAWLEKYEAEVPLDSRKVEKFERDFIKGFEPNRRLRQLFIKHNRFTQSTERNDQLEAARTIGITGELLQRGLFLSDWYVMSLGGSDGSGRRLGMYEDSMLVSEISSRCTEAAFDTLDSLLAENMSESKFIITSILNRHAREGLSRNMFRSPDPMRYGEPTPIAEYVTEATRVPVYEGGIGNKEGEFLLLDMNRLGELIELSPARDESDNEWVHNQILFRLDELGAESLVAQEIIKAAPVWLLEKGDVEKQKQHLKRFLLWTALVRHMIKWDENFWGYRLS